MSEKVTHSEPCPTEQQLLDLLAGQLDATSESAVHLHIDGCGLCRSLLAELGHAHSPTLPGGAALPDEPATFLPSERFELIRRLGAGGMGVVYEAFDRRLKAPVALKTLRRFDGRLLLRFKSEFRALADLHHPNLVQLHELFCADGLWYFSMELLRAVDFLAHVRPGGRLDERRLRAALAQLSDGLSALHGAHKVHCDLKPSNVLVTDDGRLVLVDFGLASSTDGEARHQLAGGTPAFMAPERRAGRGVEPESDWYSVGVMLFQALTGRLPSELDRALSDARAPVPPSALEPAIPPDLDALCVQLLQPDPRARPTGAALRAQLGATLERASVPAASFGSFVGRRDELSALGAALEATRTGRSLAVLVAGESGVGKSALCARFGDELAKSGATLLSGRCYERESVPYKAFDGVIDGLAALLARLPPDEVAALLPPDAALLVEAFPVLSSVHALASPLARETSPTELPADLAERRRRLFRALRALVTALGQRQPPLIVVIDDLQWSDEDSLQLLDELSRAPSILFLLTGRPATRLELSCELRRLELFGLRPEDARRLAHGLLGDGPDDSARAAQLAEEAAGHPLFIAELARHAGAQPHAHGELTLERALAARIARLDDERRALLELLAVAGRPLRPELLAGAAHTSLDAHTRHVAPLRVEQLVRSDAGALQLYHDRLREAVLVRLDGPQQRRRHAQLASALEERDRADPEMLLQHWRGAGEPARAAHYAVLSAQQAMKALAFRRAAELYQAALELDPARPDAGALEEKLGNALVGAGRHAEAARAYLEAARRSDERAAALDLKRRAAEHLLLEQLSPEGQTILDELLADLGLPRRRSQWHGLLRILILRARLGARGFRFRLRPASEVPRALLAKIDTCRSAAMGLVVIDQVEAFEFHTRRLLYALEAGEPARLAEAITLEIALAGAASGRPPRRLARLLAIADGLVKQLGEPLAEARLIQCRGTLAFYQGHWKEAEALLVHADEIYARSLGTVEQHLARMTIVQLLFFRGDLATLRARLKEHQREAEENGEPQGKLWLRQGYNVVLRLADDDLDGARAQLESSSRAYAGRQVELELWARTSLSLYGDDGVAAWRELQRRWPELVGSHALRQQWMSITLWELRGRSALAAARAKDGLLRRRFVWEVRRAVWTLERQRGEWARPHALMLRAGLALLAGERPRAAALFAEAARGFDALDMELHAAVARHRLHQLTGAGDDGARWFEAQAIRDRERFVRLFAPIG